MTGWVIAAGYIVVTLILARYVSHRFRESEDIQRDDTGDQLFAAFISLIIGLFWPVTLTFFALTGLINGRPTSRDRENEIRAQEEALRMRERDLALKERAVREWSPRDAE